MYARIAYIKPGPIRHAASSFTTRAGGSLVGVGVVVNVLVAVCVEVGGGEVVVGEGWSGVIVEVGGGFSYIMILF